MSVHPRAVARALPVAAARRLAMRGSRFASALPRALRSRPASHARSSPARGRPAADRGSHVLTTAGWNDFEWGAAKIVSNEPATKEGGLRSVKIAVDAELARAYQVPGQFVQMRRGEDDKPAFLAIASPPDAASGVFELLIKPSDGVAGEVCKAPVETAVEISPPMGKGFDLGADAEKVNTTLLVATGSGVSPIRALIKSGALDGQNVTLYYGTASPAYTAFEGEFGEWRETFGVEVVNVQSQVGGPPTYVQDAIKDDVENLDAATTRAVLCGQKEMTEAVIAILEGAGVPKERCVMNF